MINNWNDKQLIMETFIELDNKIRETRSFQESFEYQEELDHLIEEYFSHLSVENKFTQDDLCYLFKHSGRFFVLVTGEDLNNPILWEAEPASPPWKFCFDENSHCYKNITEFIPMLPSSLENNREFIKKLITKNPLVFSKLSLSIINDPEYQAIALEKDIRNISTLPKDLHIDKKYVLEFVRLNGWYISDVPDEYQNDEEVLLAAIKENPYAFNGASKTFRKDFQLNLKLIKDYNLPIDATDDSLWNNPDFILGILKVSGTKYFDQVQLNKEPFKNNRDFMITLLKENVQVFSYLPENFQKDKEFIQLKEQLEKEYLKSSIIKSDLEKELDTRWEQFLNELFKNKQMDVLEFQHLFFDTYWYFRNRVDVSVLKASGWHILSSLSSLKNVPTYFKPQNAKLNEFNAARCLCEDLLIELNYRMRGFYQIDEFVILNYCELPSGCDPFGAIMTTFENFQEAFNKVYDEFENGFPSFTYEYYSYRYNM